MKLFGSYKVFDWRERLSVSILFSSPSCSFQVSLVLHVPLPRSFHFPEFASDPLTCPITPGKDTAIDINSDNKPPGIFFIGGKDTQVPVSIPSKISWRHDRHIRSGTGRGDSGGDLSWGRRRQGRQTSARRPDTGSQRNLLQGCQPHDCLASA